MHNQTLKQILAICCVMLSCMSGLLANDVPSSVRPLLDEFDDILLKKDRFIGVKQGRIELLLSTLHNIKNPDEQYWINSQLYDEYLVFASDSALMYAERNLAISRKRHEAENIALWNIRKAFVLVGIGMMNDAKEALRQVNVADLDTNGLIEYYEQQLHLSSHILLYDADLDREHYEQLVPAYKDSIAHICMPDHPLYLWYRANRPYTPEEADFLIEELEKNLSASKFTTRIDAMNAYALSRLYETKGDKENFLKWIIYSAMADVRNVTKDIASIEVLSKELFKLGDLSRAYLYMSYCREMALTYHNRVRLYSVSKIEHSIFDQLLSDIRNQEQKRMWGMVVLSVMSLLLLVLIFYVFRVNNRLHRLQRKMRDANLTLTSQKLELETSNGKLSELNVQLQELNDKLKNSIMQLEESDYVKEEYIGAVFQLCSSYINKMDDFRRNLNRKLKTNLYDEARVMTENPTMVQNVVKEFYASFDAIFLNIYPTFVEDFNELLLPEERVHLKDGELLTTELRIFALIRMGITDSLRISQVLHCSPQTVYNNRNKTRNKAAGDRENFDEAVRKLGQK